MTATKTIPSYCCRDGLEAKREGGNVEDRAGDTYRRPRITHAARKDASQVKQNIESRVASGLTSTEGVDPSPGD